jgi:hypothetical protein
MNLKFKYQKQEDIPAELSQLYSEHNGAFLLNVDGAIDQTKVDDFRSENQSLLQQLDEVKKRFEGIDPDAVRALEAEKQKLQEQQALKAGEVEQVIESRLKPLQTAHQKQVQDLASERDSLVARLSEIQIDQGVISAASKRGLRPTAIPDITARARRVFKLHNGSPAAFDSDGKTIRPGRDGVTPMSLEEWLDSQLSEAPHLFESNVGAATANHGFKPAHPRNPFKKETWNLTEQMRLQRTDPELAARLKSQATN